MPKSGLQKCPFPVEFGPYPNMLPLAPMSHTLSGISIGSAVSAQLVVVTNKYTDRQRDHGTSVGPAIGRIFAFHARDTAIGATTTEKLERTSRGVDANPFLFFTRPFPVSRCCCTHVSPNPFPILLSFSHYIQPGAQKHCKLPKVTSEKKTASCKKLEATKYTWSLLSPKLDGTRPTHPRGRNNNQKEGDRRHEASFEPLSTDN